MKKDLTDYDVKDIKKLEYPENVRKRPQMYIGPVDNNGILTCIREIVNNSVDEHLAGHCMNIWVELDSENTAFSVEDDGRGIPYEKEVLPLDKNPVMKTIFGELHAGRNFVKKTVYSTGINGVGSSCVNALSKEFTVLSKRDDKKDNRIIVFENGIPVRYESSIDDIKGRGTIVQAILDNDLFEKDAVIDYDKVHYMLKGIKSTCPKLNIFLDYNGFRHHITPLEDIIFTDEKQLIQPAIFDELTVNENTIRVSFDYVDRMDNEIHSFCNTIETTEGGTHVTGFKRALSQGLTQYINAKGLIKEKISSDDVYPGLRALVSVFTLEPKYSSQTKQKLTNTEVMGSVIVYLNEQLKIWLDANPKAVKVIADKIALSARARIAQKKALDAVRKDNVTSFVSSNAITKFSDCLSNNPEEAELFIVEGDSASGTVGVARNKYYQAIYRLKGKPLNVYGKDVNDSRKNNEIDDLFQLLKCGTGNNFDISKLKFGKIIILSDSDLDGSHIQMLLMTMFGSYFKPLIEAGRIYIGHAPLYRVTRKGHSPVYLQNESDFHQFVLDETAKLMDIKDDHANKEEVLKVLKKYNSDLDAIHKRTNIDKSTLEWILSYLKYDDEISDDDELPLDFDYDKNTFKMNKFVNNGVEEFLAFAVETPMSLLEELFEEVYDAYRFLKEIQFIYSKSDILIRDKVGFIYKVEEELSTKLKKSLTILRMKGLGESDAEDLEATTINPANRKLTQITLDGIDDVNSLMNDFMGSNIDFRKEFLVDAIKQSDLNDLAD